MNEAMGLTAADVAAVTRNDGYDNGFGNGGWWIWIILIAFFSVVTDGEEITIPQRPQAKMLSYPMSLLREIFSIQTRTYLIQLVRHRETY